MYYSNYIFDLYGTLVDIKTDENCIQLWNSTAIWYKQHGADWSGEELWKRYLELCRKEQAKFADPLGEIELRKVFGDLFSEKGVDATVEILEYTACFFRILSTRKLRLYPWVQEQLSALKEDGSRLFLLTNAQACFTERELMELGLSDIFDGILISSDAGIKKPSGKFLDILLDRYSIPVNECLFVGNDPEADIAMAASTGMDCLYLKTESSPNTEIPYKGVRMLLDEDYSRMNELLKRPSTENR